MYLLPLGAACSASWAQAVVLDPDPAAAERHNGLVCSCGFAARRPRALLLRSLGAAARRGGGPTPLPPGSLIIAALAGGWRAKSPGRPNPSLRPGPTHFSLPAGALGVDTSEGSGVRLGQPLRSLPAGAVSPSRGSRRAAPAAPSRPPRSRREVLAFALRPVPARPRSLPRAAAAAPPPPRASG